METTQKKPQKVITTLSITKAAQDTMFDFGYASQRTQGEFISKLIVDYHAGRTHKPTIEEIAQELRVLALMLEEGSCNEG